MDSTRVELKKEREAKKAIQEKLFKATEDLQEKHGVIDSLKSDLDKLKKEFSDQSVELVKVTEALEKVEKVDISFKDCLPKY